MSDICDITQPLRLLNTHCYIFSRCVSFVAHIELHEFLHIICFPEGLTNLRITGIYRLHNRKNDEKKKSNNKTHSFAWETSGA